MSRCVVYRPVLLVLVVLAVAFASPGAASVLFAGASSPHLPSASLALGTRGSHLPAHGSTATPIGSASPLLGGQPRPSVWNASGFCAALQDHWNASFAGLPPPLDVRHTLQSPCYIGHDEPGLNFLSNASYSGERVRFNLTLPAGGTATYSAFSTFWVGMWLAGVPCSYRGQSFLEVQLNPPYSVVGVEGNPNWTVQAPVWDLVPAGSCDPQCQNDSVSTTIDGVGYCEDDAAISGVGTYTASGWGNLAPGDDLSIALVGSAQGGNGLMVYLNDTTDPSRSLAWSYSPASTVTGRPLTPFYNSSAETNGGWGYGLNVEATWENCPEAPGPAVCNSYDGPLVSSVGVPTIASATYWNSTSRSYSDPFPYVATSSSSGGCSLSSPYVAPCFDFTTWGGTGAYPYWSLHAAQGRSWWTYGGAYADQVSDYGGPSVQFAPSGIPPAVSDPTALYGLAVASASGSVSIGVRAADPGGVSAVQVGYQWCASMGSGAAVLGGGPMNTSDDGEWSTSLSGGGYKGTVHFEVRALSRAGAWSPAVYGSAVVAGTTSCTFPLPPSPWFGGSNITPVAGGYRINWTENDTALRTVTLWLNATLNGTPYTVDLPAVGPAVVPVPDPTVAYEMRLSATDWANNTSAPSAWVTSTVPLPPLTAQLTGPPGANLWVGQANASFALNVSGGSGPYSATCSFSDGTNASFGSINGSVTFGHDFGGYYGAARVACTVRDSDGLASPSNRVLVWIWATPLGVPQGLSAGDGWVNISWVPPDSPAAPVTGYTVYYTTDPGSAGYLTAAWPYNASAPYFITVWNTTATHLLVPIPDGETVFAQVVAWNAYGEGFLPSGSPPFFFPPQLSGVPAPLVASPISASPGGRAPFLDAFSSFVTGGTNFTVIYAVYTFPGQVGVTPTIEPSGNGTWVNASYTFPSPGLQTVELHVVDAVYDTAIVTTSVWVGAGVGPTVGLASSAPFGWVGALVRFTSTVSSGSGNYTYLWQFGDGANATGPDPSHAFAFAGTFGVTLSVTDNVSGGTTTDALTETVYALPQVAIVTNAGPNGSSSYTFSALTSGGSGMASIVWVFGDGTVGRGSTVTHDFGAAGSYTVGAIATDPSGRAAYANVTVDVTTGGGGPSAAGLSGTLVALILVPIALVGLVGTLYFWSVARRASAPEEMEEAGSPPPYEP